jgi:hypothetical protein
MLGFIGHDFLGRAVQQVIPPDLPIAFLSRCFLASEVGCQSRAAGELQR